jgi:hypothetical protein
MNANGRGGISSFQQRQSGGSMDSHDHQSNGNRPRQAVCWLFMLITWGASAVWANEPAPVATSALGHWAFQPVVRPEPPVVTDDEWSRSPIDAFVSARLREQDLAPAPEADRYTLIRRLSFVLTGLPPTPDEVREFAADAAPDAYERLVDRLLASPHFGERFAQMWLDVVRYAETEGYEYDNYLPGLWRYRDYVIESFNDDKPYDQFVREQLAGDELDASDDEMLVAAGFHRLGAVRRNAGNQNVASSRNEVLTERTNIIGSALLGLTIGCARCHDHKFDPLPQSDYYRLQAFVAATFEDNLVRASELEQEAWEAKTKEVNKQIEQLKRKLKRAEGDEELRLMEAVKELEAQLPPPLPTICSVAADYEKRTPIHVLDRGDPEKPQDVVGMRLPEILCGGDALELPPDTPQPRRILAEQITDPANPLTARVFVNRVWAFLMGQGIVNTPNDFGKNGDRPSHPELLDYLASEFVDGGWRIKPLVRQIVTSSTFRQAAESRGQRAEVRSQKSEVETAPASAIPHSAFRTPHSNDTPHSIDPDNRLLWRFNRRRLAAEEVRDAMLAVSGRLYERMGGQSVIVDVEQDLVDLLYKPSQWEVTPDLREHDRRSIYLLAKRNLRLPFMEVFDQPDLQTSCARRESSTHPLQALEMLNGRLANEQAEAFAERLRVDVGDNPREQIERAFWLALGREATDEERQAAEEFLQDQPLREFALAMFNLNGFLYVD